MGSRAFKAFNSNGIQPHFQLTGMHGLETLERMVRKGLYKGPLNLTWIGIGGGFDGPNLLTSLTLFIAYLMAVL